MTLPDIRQAGDIRGRRVLLRASLNVPVENGVVRNDFRLTRMMPTLAYLREQGARTVMMGHLGREKTDTLRPVFEYFKEKLPLSFSSELTGQAAEEKVHALHDGDVLLLENLRMHDGETGNDVSFARALASLGELYVNDAFAVSHRKHASIVGVPKLLPSYVGFEFENEVEHLDAALRPHGPSLFVLGGAKFETKQPLVEKFLGRYDHVFIGGALANDFFKAKGYIVGKSLVSSEELDLTALLESPKLMLPTDVVVENETGERRTTTPDDVHGDESILDVGPESVKKLAALAAECSFILWNGPLGNYEKGYGAQTEQLASALAVLSAKTVVGGGDTVAAIAKLGLYEKFNFVSIGGGAMLDYLLDGTLPGIEALTS